MRRSAEIVFQLYTHGHKTQASKALTVLLTQMQTVCGMSKAFFQVFAVLEEVKVAIEREDFESGQALLLAILVRLRQVEALLQGE